MLPTCSHVASYVYTVNNKTYAEKNFCSFYRFSMNHESFTNFISAILSANIHSKSHLHAYQKQNCESFPYTL